MQKCQARQQGVAMPTLGLCKTASAAARRLPTMLGISVLLLSAGCGENPQPLFPPGQASHLAKADPERGLQRIVDYGCVACHTIPGVRRPLSGVGPPLDKMALRAYVGGVLPNTPRNLVRWMRDPPAIDPRTAMPNMGISVADANDIAAYLLTLH